MARVVHVPHRPCPNCQRTIAVSQAVCPHCGVRTAGPTRPCPNCGVNVLTSQLACPSCKFPLTNARAASADPAIAQIIASSPAFQNNDADIETPVALPLRIAIVVIAAGVGLVTFGVNVARSQPAALHDLWVSAGPNAGAIVFLATLFGALMGYPCYTWLAVIRRLPKHGWGWQYELDFVSLATSSAASLVYILVALAICRAAPAGPVPVQAASSALATAHAQMAPAFGAIPMLIGFMVCAALCQLGNSAVAWRRYIW